MKTCRTCNKPPMPQRTLCATCRKRKARILHPLKHAFYDLRTNAKRRGISFDLTFDQFKKFAIKTEYVYGRGKSKDSFHIDRINPNKGYTTDNIQVLSNELNQLKKYLDYSFDELLGFQIHGVIINRPDIKDYSDLPF